MTDVATTFGLATLVIFIGFLSTLMFEKTRIPDVLVLIALGIVVGPVTGILSATELAGITPVFGALALTLILFDGGLDLRYDEVVRKFGSVALLIGASLRSRRSRSRSRTSPSSRPRRPTSPSPSGRSFPR